MSPTEDEAILIRFGANFGAQNSTQWSRVFRQESQKMSFANIKANLDVFLFFFFLLRREKKWLSVSNWQRWGVLCQGKKRDGGIFCLVWLCCQSLVVDLAQSISFPILEKLRPFHQTEVELNSKTISALNSWRWLRSRNKIQLEMKRSGRCHRRSCQLSAVRFLSLESRK